MDRFGRLQCPPGPRRRSGGDRAALPFAREPSLPRAYVDRKITADLALLGEFSFEVSAADPAGIGQLSLYFHSGDGWYAAGYGPPAEGLARIRFSKAAFRIEGRPAGWNRIDGVRIAVWRRRPATALRIGPAAALWHDVALVIPSAAALHDQGETPGCRAGRRAGGRHAGRLGLGADAVDERPWPTGHWRPPRGHPGLQSGLAGEAAGRLGAVRRRGRKTAGLLPAAATAPAALGFGNSTYVRPERPEQFAAIRFEAPDVPGLPRRSARPRGTSPPPSPLATVPG